METHQNPKNHAARDLHHDVFPCVSPGKVPMLPPQVNLTDRPWPFLGSFALHAVLVAIISCPAFQYPIFISSQTPAIFWFSPASLPDTSTEAESPLHGPSVAFAAQQEASVNEPFQSPASADDPVRAEYQEAAPEPPADIAEPELAIATPVPVKKTVDTLKSPKPPSATPRRPTPVPTPLSAPAPKKMQEKNVTVPLAAEPESPRALPAIQPAMIRTAESQLSDNAKSLQNKDDRISRHIIEQNQLAAENLRREQIAREQELGAIQEKIELERAAAEKVRQKQLAAETLRREQMAQEQEHRATQEKIELERAAAAITRQKQQAAERLRREQESRAIQGKLELERAAAEKARLKKLASDSELLKRKNLEEDQRRREIERVVLARKERNVPAVSTGQSIPAPQQHKKTAETPSPVKPPEKTMSVSLPLIKGDLKLVITGAILPDTSVTFRDFALSRRDRPFSRAESRRNIKVVPLIAHSRDTVREVVISRANPGVYTITAESAKAPADIIISLKLYEGTSRAVTRELGKHTIARKKVLIKILMPDGILWDDVSAFSGNMEDSDGVTKFNTRTGLMWKEYNE